MVNTSKIYKTSINDVSNNGNTPTIDDKSFNNTNTSMVNTSKIYKASINDISINNGNTPTVDDNINNNINQSEKYVETRL